jgi:hypothetical protein
LSEFVHLSGLPPWMSLMGHQRRMHSAGAVSGPSPIATDRHAPITAAVRSNGPAADDKCNPAIAVNLPR